MTEAHDLYDLENRRLFQHPLPAHQEGGDGATESTLGRVLSAFEAFVAANS